MNNFYKNFNRLAFFFQWLNVIRLQIQYFRTAYASFTFSVIFYYVLLSIFRMQINYLGAHEHWPEKLYIEGEWHSPIPRSRFRFIFRLILDQFWYLTLSPLLFSYPRRFFFSIFYNCFILVDFFHGKYEKWFSGNWSYDSRDAWTRMPVILRVTFIAPGARNPAWKPLREIQSAEKSARSGTHLSSTLSSAYTGCSEYIMERRFFFVSEFRSSANFRT